jgi:phosphatidylglycerophosphate synthase
MCPHWPSGQGSNLIFKKNIMKMRDRLQQGIYAVINPLVRGLIKIGFTPNLVTLTGLVINMCAAVIFVVGAEEGHRGDLSYVGWAGATILFAGLFDMLDGQVARLGKMSSKFGALFDSVLDRYSELIMFLGICYYLVAHHYFLSSLFAFIALIGSMMVSYTRARAEGLGIECKGGLMQRPERIVIISLSAIACGITAHYIGGDYKVYIPGIPFHVFETMSIFTFPLTVMAVMTNITAIRRLMDAKRSLEVREKKMPQKSNRVTRAAVLVLGLSFMGYAFSSEKENTNPNEESFPVPKVENMLFYIQRTNNTNTIVYQLNTGANGRLNESDPVNIFWIRYAEQGQQQPLSYLQRKLAYGLITKKTAEDTYELRFAAKKGHPLYLAKDNNGQFHVYSVADGKKIILQKIFIRINGGTALVPKIQSVKLSGIDPVTQKPLSSTINP